MRFSSDDELDELITDPGGAPFVSVAQKRSTSMLTNCVAYHVPHGLQALHTPTWFERYRKVGPKRVRAIRVWPVGGYESATKGQRVEENGVFEWRVVK